MFALFHLNGYDQKNEPTILVCTPLSKISLANAFLNFDSYNAKGCDLLVSGVFPLYPVSSDGLNFDSFNARGCDLLVSGVFPLFHVMGLEET